MPARTSKHTLYRLVGVPPNLDGLFDALDSDQIDGIGGDVEVAPRFAVIGIPALVVFGAIEKAEAEWCDELRRTTGCAVSVHTRRSAGLLLLGVDEHSYGIGYDQGFRLIPDRFKDTNFGLHFALRAVDPSAVSGLTSKVLGERRTDIAMVPDGTPVSRLGVDECMRIVQRVQGALKGVELTRSRRGGRGSTKLAGGNGLELAYGIDTEDLVADIREIARVCEEKSPHPELEFIEHVAPVKDAKTLVEVERAWDALLDGPGDQVTFAVPAEHVGTYAETRQVRIRIDCAEWRSFEEFDLEHVLHRAKVQRPGRRQEELRAGKVELYAHRDVRPADKLASTNVLRWLEASLSIGTRHFHLTDGNWYEIGDRYLADIAETLARVITSNPSVKLPPWSLGEGESDYNHNAPRRCKRQSYLCLDTKTVRNPLKSPDMLEICDLLADDGTLVMVKKARGSGALSHLFHQGLVATQMLLYNADVRSRFIDKVTEISGGQVVWTDFRPRRVVFAILLKDGVELSPKTLFAFSQVALMQTVRALQSWGVDVEVVGIEAAAPQE